MLCRVVLATIVVSYLVCVLWLSGLQKEDFDVNMLRKLQRHNVNIDDMNNEIIKQQCANRSNSIANITQKSEVTTTMSTVGDNDFETSQILNDEKNSYLETIAKYFTDKITASNNKQPEVHEQTKIYSQNNLQQSSYAENFSNTNTNYNQKQEANNGTENIDESLRPDLQKILQFWRKFEKPEVNHNQDIKEESYVLRTVDVEKLPVTQIVTETTSQAALPNDKINQLLSEYLSRNLVVVSTTMRPTTTKANDPESNLKSLYYKLIANNSNRKRITEDIFPTLVTPYTFNDKASENINNVFRQPHAMPNNMAENVEPLENTIKNLGELLLLNDQLKSYAARQLYPNNIAQIPKQNENNTQTSESATDILWDVKELKYKPLANLLNKQPKNSNIVNIEPKLQERSPAISNDVIKGIAEHIKDLVLQDLRQKNIWNSSSATFTTTMLSISPKSTTVESSTVTTIKSKLENTSDETHQVIERFLELFEQVKAIKEKTIITADTKYRMTNVNHEYLNIINKTSMNQLSVTKPWRTRNVVNLSNGIQPYPVINIPMFHNATPHEKRIHLPSIIQTNSDEIAPLAIPITNPTRIINQVLLVTSANTEHQRWAQPVTPKINAYFDNRYTNGKVSHDYTSRIGNRNRDDKRTRYADSNKYYKVHGRQRPEYHNNDKETHDRLQEYQVNYNDNLNNFNDMYNRDNHEQLHNLGQTYIDIDSPPRHRNRERFHEKLERGDSSYAGFNKNRHINGRPNFASRQQQPVNSLKKNFRYNDIHFRNFLKTQQKVNAMLERILATKPAATDGPPQPYSVELA